jgi:hypothetical protein
MSLEDIEDSRTVVEGMNSCLFGAFSTKVITPKTILTADFSCGAMFATLTKAELI